MSFIQRLLHRFEYGDYTPVAKYGQIYSEKIGKEVFTLSPQLLKGTADWVLRLDLNRRWGSTGDRTMLDLHFRTLDELYTPIQKLLNDVSEGVNRPNFNQKSGLFDKMVLNATAGTIVRSYGRIDHHPKDTVRFRVELFLSWDGQRHWMLLCEGQGSVEWSKWPASVAEALNKLFPQIHQTMKKAGIGKQAP